MPLIYGERALPQEFNAIQDDGSVKKEIIPAPDLTSRIDVINKLVGTGNIPDAIVNQSLKKHPILERLGLASGPEIATNERGKGKHTIYGGYNPGLFTLMHEIGHGIDADKNYLSGATWNPSTLLGFIAPWTSGYRALRRERDADNNVRTILNGITDTKLRDDLLNDYNSFRKACNSTYDIATKAGRTGGMVGGLAGMGLGGYFGYKGGKRFADWMGWRESDKGMKKFLRNLSKYGIGVLGGIGGSWAGTALGGGIASAVLNTKNKLMDASKDAYKAQSNDSIKTDDRVSKLQAYLASKSK